MSKIFDYAFILSLVIVVIAYFKNGHYDTAMWVLLVVFYEAGIFKSTYKKPQSNE